MVIKGGNGTSQGHTEPTPLDSEWHVEKGNFKIVILLEYTPKKEKLV